MLRKWIMGMLPALACLLTALPASAQGVSDELNLFSKEAKDRANRDIADIKRIHKKDLLIETRKAPEIPEAIKKDSKEVDRFISKWAEQQFANHKTNGVYVVITEKPNKVRVQVGNETSRLGYFRSEDAIKLRDTIGKNLKDKKNDEALTSATTSVFLAMDHRPKAAAPAAAPARQANHGENAAVEHGSGGGMSIMTILLWVGGFLLVFWIVRALIGALSGGGGGYGGAPGYGGGGGGGGGFLSSMMGGLFGAAAGMWMYNHFLGGSTPSAFGGTHPSNPGDPTDTSSTGTGGDWGSDGPADDAGGGGDWGGGGGDAGGGGDWGGGDAGGGGGGDWGGGGGDFGGGGGDFGGGGGGDW